MGISQGDRDKKWDIRQKAQEIIMYISTNQKSLILEHFIHFPCNADKGFAPISFGHEPNMLLFTLNRTSITRTETVKYADI